MPAGANQQQQHQPMPTQPPTACCRGQHTLLSLHQAQHHSTLCMRIAGLLGLSVLLDSVLLHGSAELSEPAAVTHDTTGQTHAAAPKMCTHDWTAAVPVSKWCPTPLLQHLYAYYLLDSRAVAANQLLAVIQPGLRGPCRVQEQHNPQGATTWRQQEV